LNFKNTYNHVVPVHLEKRRCSEYLIGVFPGLETKNSVKKALKQNKITIGAEIASTGTWILGGEEIIYHIDHSKVMIWNEKIFIHFEDDNLAIVEKPAGIPTSGNQFCNLRNALPFNLKPSPLEDRMLQPEPIHRLDAGTSGLVIVAKTWQSRRLLGNKMKYKGIFKEYLALVDGEITMPQLINLTIDHKPAFTMVEKKAAYLSPTYGLLTLVSAFPYTGRTHQIRIHLASKAHPILGDKLYNLQKSGKARGLFLHAHRVAFYHPISNNRIEVVSPIPKKFQKRFSKWKKVD
jgi:tRNA pseudouridine65 synthase/23S rRNA pseudouridine1911/1915/1917 synthase